MKGKGKDPRNVERRNFLKVTGMAGVGAALGLSATGNTRMAYGKARRPIKVGMQAILSGPLAGYGEYQVRGCDLAMEHINAMGGILGHPIEMKYRDSELNPAVGVKNARYFIQDWGADFITGTDSSPLAKAVGEVLPELKKIFIVTHAATHDIHEVLVYQKKIKYLFRSEQSFYQDSYAGALVAAQLGAKRWFMIGPDEEYGYKNWEMFKAFLGKFGNDIQFVGQTWVPYGTTDFTPHLSKAMSADPDGIFSTEWGGELVSCIKQAKMMGMFKKIKGWLTGMGAGMDVLEGLGKDYPEACWGSCRYWFQYPNTKTNYDFVKAFVGKYNRFPHYSSEGNYSALLMYKGACEKAGTVDDVDRIVAAMEGLAFDSPAGVRWIRPEDHACCYSVPWGRIMHDSRYPMPVLTDWVIKPWPYYWPSPPPDYTPPPGPGELPMIPHVPYKK
jgi:branched-chain amino acid transport system substrate-binding protein